MAILLIILFGALQGLTEFLPVSSSGHLTLFQFFTSELEGNLTLNIAVHIGTLLTVVIFYREEILAILSGLLRRERESLMKVMYISLALIPTVILGLLMKMFFHQFLTSAMVSSICLFITGFILFSTKKMQPIKEKVTTFGMNPKVALLLGFVQGIAVLPGLSRSGLTIVAALWLGVDHKNAAKFSFLISVPAIFGAGLLEFIGGSSSLDWTQMGIGMIASFLVGLIAIDWMVRLTKSKKLYAFAYYVWAVGLFTLAFQLS